MAAEPTRDARCASGAKVPEGRHQPPGAHPGGNKRGRLHTIGELESGVGGGQSSQETLKLAAIPTGIGLSLLPFRVHAGSEDKQGGISLKVEELSLYTKPEDDYKYVVETTELEESISTVRKSVEPYTTWVQDFLTVLKPKIEHSVHLGKESYEFLKNPPPGFYPRFGVIGFTGIIGLFLARGSRIKKLIYPSGLMALSTSLYYPQQAVTVAKVSINTANSK
ncbi:MIC26 protein, partial [Polypterus senegalus]